MPAVSQVLTGSRTVVSGDGLTIDITISSVTVARSIVMYTVRSADAASRLQRHIFAAHLTGATTLRLQRYESSDATSAVVEWTVVEFAADALANLQTGLITPSATTTNTTITAVDTDAAFPILTQNSSGADASDNDRIGRATFQQTSVPGDTLRLTFDSTTNLSGSGYRFQVVEFEAADAAVQSGTISASSSYTATATISTVDLDAALLTVIGNGAGDGNRGWTLFKFNSATQIWMGRQEYGTALSPTAAFFAIEMLDGSVVEAGQVSIANSSTAPTQPSWSPALTDGVVFNAISKANARIVASNDSSQPRDVQHSVTLDSGQLGATITRVGTTNQVDVYWQVIDWQAAASGVTIDFTTGAAVGAGLAGNVASAITVAANVGAAVGAGLTGGVSTGVTVAGNVGAAVGAGLTGNVASAITIAAGVGAAVGAGLAANVASAITIAGGVGAAEAAGLTGSVSSGSTVAGTVGAAVAAGLTANVASAITIAGGIGAAEAAGLTGSVSSGSTVAGSVGAAVAAGLTGNVASAITIAAGVGAAVGAGLGASVSTGNEISAGVGAAVAAGLTGGVASSITIAANVGAAVGAGLTGSISTGATIPAGIGAALALGLTGTVTATTHITLGVGAAVGAGLQGSIVAGGALLVDMQKTRRIGPPSVVFAAGRVGQSRIYFAGRRIGPRRITGD